MRLTFLLFIFLYSIEGFANGNYQPDPTCAQNTARTQCPKPDSPQAFDTCRLRAYASRVKCEVESIIRQENEDAEFGGKMVSGGLGRATAEMEAPEAVSAYDKVRLQVRAQRSDSCVQMVKEKLDGLTENLCQPDLAYQECNKVSEYVNGLLKKSEEHMTSFSDQRMGGAAPLDFALTLQKKLGEWVNEMNEQQNPKCLSAIMESTGNPAEVGNSCTSVYNNTFYQDENIRKYIYMYCTPAGVDDAAGWFAQYMQNGSDGVADLLRKASESHAHNKNRTADLTAKFIYITNFIEQQNPTGRGLATVKDSQ